MDNNFKIIEVFKGDKTNDIVRRLVWEDNQVSQYIVQSLDDPENLYYAEDFISLCYGLGHKVILHND